MYNNNRCLVDPGQGNTPGLHDCKVAKEKGFHMHWDFKQVITHKLSIGFGLPGLMRQPVS